MIALDDGRCYVGGATSCSARWRRHLHDLRHGKHHSKILQRAWNKYGGDRFSFSIIEKCDTSDLVVREQHWLDTLSPEFNVLLIARSSLGFKHTEETKLRLANISARSQLGRKHSDESKKKRSDALKGRKPSPQTVAALIAACKGRKLTPEHREKIGAASRRMSQETKDKIGAAGMGRKQSPETIAKRAAHRIGKPLSETTKAKIKAAAIERHRAARKEREYE